MLCIAFFSPSPFQERLSNFMREIAFRNKCENSPSKYPSPRKLGIKKPLPIEDKDFKMVGPVGFEPTTKGL